MYDLRIEYLDKYYYICYIHIVSPAGVNGGYYQGGALPVQQAHSTTPHEVPHTVAPSAAPQTPQPQPPAGPVIPPHLVS